MVGQSADNELQIIWIGSNREVQVPARNISGGTKKKHVNLRQDSKPPDLHSDGGLPEYKSEE
jgi:hypothetical protein